LADPFLTFLGQTVAPGHGNREQRRSGVETRSVGEGVARTYGHGVVLAADQMGPIFAVARMRQPLRDRLTCLLAGPEAVHLLDRERGVAAHDLAHPLSPVTGGRSDGVAEHVEDPAAPRQQRAELPALNASEILLIGCDQRDGDGGELTLEGRYLSAAVAVQEDPADAAGGHPAGQPM